MKKLMFSIMLFSLTIILIDNASAQNICTKDVDNKQVNFQIINKTNKPFVVNWVGYDCKEAAGQQVAPGATYTANSFTGHAYRIREVGTNKLLREFAVDPSKRSQVITGPDAPANSAVKPTAPAPGNQQSNTAFATRFPISAGLGLKKNVKYPSPSGNHYLILQDGGNMVIYTKTDGYVWGLDQMKKNTADRVELGKDGVLAAYNAQGKNIWSPQAKADPNAKLNMSFNGALQLVAANGDILWSSDGVLAKSVKVFSNATGFKPCAAVEAGWAKCIEMTNPKITITRSKLVTDASMNAVANVYAELFKRFGVKYPKSTFDGFKVYITNGEAAADLAKMTPLPTFGEDGTGPKSRDWIRGGANRDFIWVEEQMICKQGVKTRLRDYPNDPDNTVRTFDQVIHEFGHAIEQRYKMEQTVNNIFRGGKMTPREAFPYAIQSWFGAPAGTLTSNQEALMNELFTSRAAFSCEGYKP